jgi:hypothetical protein
MSFAAFRTKIIAKQENARDRRQLPVSEHNFPTCCMGGHLTDL